VNFNTRVALLSTPGRKCRILGDLDGVTRTQEVESNSSLDLMFPVDSSIALLPQ